MGIQLSSFHRIPENNYQLSNIILTKKCHTHGIINEWIFKELKNKMFPFLRYPDNLKIHLQPVGITITASMILHNAHVCLHHPQITQYFRTDPLNQQEISKEL